MVYQGAARQSAYRPRQRRWVSVRQYHLYVLTIAVENQFSNVLSSCPLRRTRKAGDSIERMVSRQSRGLSGKNGVTMNTVLTRDHIKALRDADTVCFRSNGKTTIETARTLLSLSCSPAMTTHGRQSLAVCVLETPCTCNGQRITALTTTANPQACTLIG